MDKLDSLLQHVPADLARQIRECVREDLRDRFAAQALPVAWRDIPDDVDRGLALKQATTNAYEMADWMLRARAR